MIGSVFDQIVSQSGLSPLFARNALERAIKRAGLSPEGMTRQDVEKAIPELERTIATFLPEDVSRVVERLRRIGR